MIRFTTESGSIYEVDYDACCWARIKATSKSGRLRTDTAQFFNNPVVKLGQPVAFWSDALPTSERGTVARIIYTTPVTDMEEFDDIFGETRSDETLSLDTPDSDKRG